MGAYYFCKFEKNTYTHAASRFSQKWFFGRVCETLESSQAKGGLDSKEYLDALEKGTSARKIIDDLMLKHRLLSLAYGYEQASKKRVAPEFKPTLLSA